MVPGRTWRVHAVWMAPTERFKLRRHMAAAAGKKCTTSYDFAVPFSWRALVWRWRRISLLRLLSIGHKVFGQDTGTANKKKRE